MTQYFYEFIQAAALTVMLIHTMDRTEYTVEDVNVS